MTTPPDAPMKIKNKIEVNYPKQSCWASYCTSTIAAPILDPPYSVDLSKILKKTFFSFKILVTLQKLTLFITPRHQKLCSRRITKGTINTFPPSSIRRPYSCFFNSTLTIIPYGTSPLACQTLLIHEKLAPSCPSLLENSTTNL